MKKRTLKYLMMAITALTACTQAITCPTCVGRLMLGIKKPFFEMYRPRAINKRRRKKTKLSQKKKKSPRRNYTNEQKSHELIKG